MPRDFLRRLWKTRPRDTSIAVTTGILELAPGRFPGFSRASLSLPDEACYAAVALAQSISKPSNLNLADETRSGANFSLSGDALTLLAPFAAIQAGATPNTYFAFASANPDGLAHFRIFGDNIFGLEDQLDGGDNDYDNLVVNFRSLALV